MSSYCNVGRNSIWLPLTLNLASEGLVAVVLLLEFGVVGLLVFGVVDLLDIDPVRKSGNLCGDTVRFSKVHVKIAIQVRFKSLALV